MSGVICPSYKAGFAAPGRLRPKYPQLQRGCVGSWAPLLGPSGSTLRDVVGKNHAVFTGINPSSGWRVSGGAYSIHTENSQYALAGTGNLSGYSNYTFAGWCTQFFTTTAGVLIANRIGTGIICHLSVSNDVPTFLVRDNASNTVIASSSVSIVTSTWTHLAGVRIGNNIYIYVNGVETGTATTTLGAITDGPVSIGHSINGSSSNYFEGNLDDLHAYNRALTPNEIRLLASRRGIAYETEQRRSYKASAAATTKNLTLLGVG